MKQNSSIMFHGSVKQLEISDLYHWKDAVFAAACGFFTAFATVNARAAEPPAPPVSFDPDKGFKPAQSDLKAVFLQIAASLEFYGSPEPYLRHMIAEHARIEAKYQKQLGKKPRSFCPAYMDAAYFDRFAANWKHIAPQLGLEALAKNTGHLMQLAINGMDGKGTMLLKILDEHQRRVHAAMTDKRPTAVPGFDVLKAGVVKCARFDESPSELTKLNADEQVTLEPANQIRTDFLELFSALDAGLAPANAEKMKTVLAGIGTDLGRMAQSEIEVAVIEKSLDELLSPKSPYTVEKETALSAEERKIFAGLLQKPRFMKADFPALERFYSGPYDRLTERGKDEMSKRFWDGIRDPR